MSSSVTRMTTTLDAWELGEASLDDLILTSLPPTSPDACLAEPAVEEVKPLPSRK